MTMILTNKLSSYSLPTLALMGGIVFYTLCSYAQAANHQPFIGKYAGNAEIKDLGVIITRDLSVEISDTPKGFKVVWRAITHKADGRTKDREYDINFVASKRPGIYSSAMRTNVFGGAEALDPMQGDPFVWARIQGDILTVFSLLIIENGGYEMQIYDRKLVPEGLELNFQRHRNGEELKQIKTLLIRQ